MMALPQYEIFIESLPHVAAYLILVGLFGICFGSFFFGSVLSSLLETVRIAHDIIEHQSNRPEVRITKGMVQAVQTAWHIMSFVFLLFAIAYSTLIIWVQFGVNAIGK